MATFSMVDPLAVGEGSTRGEAAPVAIATLARLAGEIARDADQPRLQSAGLAQLPERTPRRDERVLRHVLAERPVARRAVRDRTDDVLIPRDEMPERFALAAAACLD